MKRIVILLTWAICILLIAGAITVGSGYLWSLRTKPEMIVLPESADVSCAGALPLGAETSVTVRLKLPVWSRVTAAELTAPEGTVLAGPVKKTVRQRWATRIWEFQGTLRSYRTGEAKNGKIHLTITRRGREIKRGIVPIPAFFIGAETAEKTPLQDFHYAGSVELPHPASRYKLWILIGAGVLLLLLVLWALWYFRCRNDLRAAARPFWETTLDALSVLRGDLRTHRENGERGVVRLTDLVRGYLEKRFALPLTTLTTPEFLEKVDRKLASELPEERPFLREFMNAADFVKFARVPADAGLLEQAVDRAEALVRRTVPKPEAEETSAPGKGVSSC